MAQVKKGLILINTGNGKGKTTAALGLALRAAGHGLKVLILQFIKGPWKSGELISIKKISQIEIKSLGAGFINFKDGKPAPDNLQIKNSKDSFNYAKEIVAKGAHDIIILDEILNLVSYKLLDLGDLLDLLKNKPEKLTIVLTGNKAHKKLIEIADTVTEMKAVKHAYNKGIKAIKGIEY